MSYGKTRRRMDRRIALLLACAAPLALAMPGAAAAQGESMQNFSIPAGSLSGALQAYSAQTGIQLVYSSDLVSGKSSSGVNGQMTPAEALARLLAGTGLSGSLSGNTATISGAGAGGELVTGVVSVEGYQGSPYFGGAGVAAGVNGINGSRDITATEGTGSLTSGALTIGSKAPQAIKDVPHSVSVLTAELLEQRNVTDFTSAMKQLPGITLVQGDSAYQNYFFSRGFLVQSFQIDGGAPLIVGNNSLSLGYFPQIDMAQYDHIELLRGADGTFNGYGSPGGAVNLVRKKPLEHGQITVEGQIGSWNNYRLMMDVTSPLAFDGKLRGRLVTLYQDNDYFYDLAHDNKVMLYGIAEADVTSSTLITGGISYTQQDSLPWLSGMPRYQNGDDLKLPRSTSFAVPWSRWSFETTEFFGGLEQKIGNDWTAKLNVTYNRQDSYRKAGFLTGGGVNPYTGAGPGFIADLTDYGTKQLSIEATVAGSIELLGQRQEITIGANRVNSDGSGQLSYESPIYAYLKPYQPYPGGPVYCVDYGAGICPPGSIPSISPPVDVFNFNPDDPLYGEPPNSLPDIRSNELQAIQSGIYANVKLTPFGRLHLNMSVRWGRYENRYNEDILCTSIPDVDPFPGFPSCYGRSVGDAYITNINTFEEEHFSWPPSGSLSFDATRNLTLYVGYSDIYQSQANYRTGDGDPIDPITGSNWEAGVKWAGRDGRLNLSAAAYRIDRKGFALSDPAYPPYQEVEPGIYCCFLPNSDNTERSQGFDLEATGEVLPGLQVAASYTFNENKQLGGSNDGKLFVTIQPKHLYKLWVSYDFGAGGASGALSGLTISGGLNGQSAAYFAGFTCVNLLPPVNGYSDCKSYSDPDYIEYKFTVPSYAIASARIDYRVSDVWSLAVNLDNIFDKTYYSGVGQDIGFGNWYGTPRSFTASLRGKW